MEFTNFRKIALALGGLIGLFAIMVAVYLYYNFKAKSNLSLMIPQEVNWVYHFQTKELRSKLPSEKPEYIDSLSNTMAKLPIFSGVKEPADVGIALYSDVVVFQNDKGWHCLLRLNNPSNFSDFMKKMQKEGYVEEESKKDLYKVRKSAKSLLWIAYQQKVLCLFIPSDTIPDKYGMNKNMEQLFTPGHLAVNQLDDFSELFNNTDAYFYHRTNPGKSFGFKVEGDYMKNIYLSSDSMHPSPLMFFDKLGAKVTSNDVDDYLNKDNQLTLKGFFNEHFKVVNEYLKPFLP